MFFLRCTIQILSTMVMKLKQFPNMKFIWAEISYLARWWADQNTQVLPPYHSIRVILCKKSRAHEW
jgi:hypothetical protein